jgi:hypothetical protein
MLLRKGQTFRALVDIDAACLVRLRPPLMRETRVSLRAGEVFCVTFVPPFKSPRIHCRPDRYETLEREFVDRETRHDPEYRGYGLGVDPEVVKRDCEIVSPSDDRPS